MKKIILAFTLFIMAVCGISDTSSFTIYIIGDSTVCGYKDSAYPQTGWGQLIHTFFDESRVKVVNHAIGGRSSKSFINEGRFDAVLALAKPGDFIFLQMGTNDRDFSKADRYVPIDSSAYWFQRYVDGAKSKGATLVMMSPLMMNTLPRNVFDTKYSNRNEYDVRPVIEEIARKNGVPFVDLNLKTYNLHKSLDAAYVSRYLFKYFLPGEYPNYPDGVTNDGTTHFQETGSVTHAQAIIEGIEEAYNSTSLSAEAKAQLAILISTIKPRYDLKVKTNISGNGLITHAQKLPKGAPLNLHVSPGSFNQAFDYWADDDCNKVTADSNYYKVAMPGRAITYTAMFKGGSACVPTAHESETLPPEPSPESSSSSVVPESSSGIQYAIFEGSPEWPSPIDMAYPTIASGYTETNHEGYTGAGFYNIENAINSTATYKISSLQSAESARMLIRYCNGGTSDREMIFQIDYSVHTVSFPPSRDWDTWDTAYVDGIWIDAVDNFDFKITSNTADGGPNLDRVAFNIKGVYRAEAEPANVFDDTDKIFTAQKLSSLSVDLNHLKISTPGGLLKVTLFTPLGQKVSQTLRNVSAGTVDLLTREAMNLPRGKYIAEVSLDGRLKTRVIINP